MKTSLEFLDSVKAAQGFTSDYQLSKYLNCTRGAISSYRTGRTFLDEEMACKIAHDLGIDSSYVLACIASERAKKPEVKAAWAHAAEVLYGLAAGLFIVFILPTFTLPEGAVNLAFLGFTSPTLYIMSNQFFLYSVLFSVLCLSCAAFIMKRHNNQN